ncbi:hypothetical protein F3J37_01830 [Pantoea sp. Al-1710]|uniref:Uncharacterized protein n=1 Tax=Candidatus Pantoea communis TaxID=2608354 RepID=A0ABX0RLR6_9GAMM|nr:hypothetical protein [Pantoea communis]NIG17418.1 hypothetical protein [Pantoea communis]
MGDEAQSNVDLIECMHDHDENHEAGLEMKEQKPSSYYGLIALKWLFRALGVMSILCILGVIPKPNDDNLLYAGFVIIWALSELDWYRRKNKIKESQK